MTETIDMTRAVRARNALFAVFAANGIAAAIPSATVLFFVADVLQAAELAGLFLVLYFVAAAASLPLWVRVSQHIGKLRAWLASMVLAVAVFAWAGLLGGGDLVAYGLICVLSGLALGADDDRQRLGGRQGGAHHRLPLGAAEQPALPGGQAR